MPSTIQFMNSALEGFNKNLPRTSLKVPKDPFVAQQDKYLNSLTRNVFYPQLASNKPISAIPGQVSSEIDITRQLGTMNYKKAPSSKFNKFLNGTGGTAAGMGTDILSSIIPNYVSDPTSQLLDQGVEMASDLAMMIPGGQPIGLALKAAGFLGKGINALTGGALTMDKSTSGVDKILSSNTLNWTPVGVLNKLTSSKVKGTDDDLANMALSGYGSSDVKEDYERGGIPKFFDKISGLFGKKNSNKVANQKANVKQAESTNLKKAFVSQYAKDNTLAAMNSTANVDERNKQQLQGGFGNLSFLAAKKGTKLQLKNIKRKVSRKLQQGGKLNVIVEGALHARKHNIDIDGITRKGIPVVSIDEKGGVIQHAEVEREELILHKDLTDILEALYKKYKAGDENVAIEAGKLLAYEILENTEDNTNLINTIENDYKE